ncbi:MAG: hypothetical protein ACLSUW_04150 [Akkermansia sp.]
MGNEEVILPQGKSLLIPAGVPHSVIARNGSKCWLLHPAAGLTGKPP